MIFLALLSFTSITQAQVTITYNYDETTSTHGKGRLTSMTDPSGSSKFYYNNMGQISRTDKVVDGTTYTLQAGYDLLGRTFSITYPDNSVVNYAYNGPLLERVYEGATNYAQYGGYNALGQPGTVTHGNGVVTTSTYSNSTNGTCPKQNFRPCTIAIGNFQTLTYDYDNGQLGVGNITSITNTANGNQTFAYDDLDRLTSTTGPYGTGGATATLTYAYDQIGNMTSNSKLGTYTYPASGVGSVRPHAVSTAGANSYGYDDNGNMISGAGRTISYNSENRPTSITNAGGTTTFVYDGNGERVKKIIAAGTTIYIGKLYECTNGGCSKYIFAGSQRIALKTVGAATVHYYHSDHLGSSSVITNQSGAKVQDLAYFPYGQTRLNSGTVDVHHKYTSQEFDDSTALYFYNARYYDPVLGRFIQADTIVPDPTDPQAFNRYSYVQNNPLKYTDPTGHGVSFRGVRKGVKKTVKKAADNVRGGVKRTADAIRGGAGQVADAAREVRDFQREAIDRARDAARDAIDRARAAARDAIDKARAAQREAIDRARDAARDAIDRVADNIRAGIREGADFIRDNSTTIGWIAAPGVMAFADPRTRTYALWATNPYTMAYIDPRTRPYAIGATKGAVVACVLSGCDPASVALGAIDGAFDVYFLDTDLGQKMTEQTSNEVFDDIFGIENEAFADFLSEIVVGAAVGFPPFTSKIIP